jgi:hypothetical protein
MFFICLFLNVETCDTKSAWRRVGRACSNIAEVKKKSVCSTSALKMQSVVKSLASAGRRVRRVGRACSLVI